MAASRTNEALHQLPRPVLERFGEVGGFDVVGTGKVGDGAGEFERRVEY
jgi:hypothetical protein